LPQKGNFISDTMPILTVNLPDTWQWNITSVEFRIYGSK